MSTWSEQQLKAIKARNQNVLVAAAAGSGKTSVLVERIIQRITDDKDPLDVDKVLVVTFTNAAAAEMRARIGQAITKALKNGGHSRHLERQLVLLNSSSISTIHSFCQSVIRQNFHLLDLDPQFRIAGEAECTLLKNDVLENMFEELYSASDEAFLQFVEHYGDDHSDQPLYDLILGLYSFSRSHPWPDYWLVGLNGAFNLTEDTAIDDTCWSELIRGKLIIEMEQARQEIEALAAEAAQPGNPSAYGGVFEADRILIEDLISSAAHSWAKAEAALAAVSYAKLPTVKGLDAEVKKHFQGGRQRFKDKVAKFRSEYFNTPADDLLADMRRVAPLVKVLADLTIDFGRRYAEAKKTKGLLDFNDLEHFCLKVLVDESAKPGEIIPSFVAKAMRDKYAEIMIDEYQDTNGVQETILKLIAKTDSPNLFMVGDVKQSIYRFRLAEPELFMRKYTEYPAHEGRDCRRIDLAQNFRSRAEILHAVNFLFAQLMAPRVAELTYGEAEKLNPGPAYPECDGILAAGPTELCLINLDGQESDGDEEAAENVQEGLPEDTEKSAELSEEEELTGFELEARLVAKKILSMMDAEVQIFDKNNKQYRSLSWRDIVILLRSTKGKAGVLLETLRQAGIPVYAEVDSGYFREIEVQVMLSLLTVIDNPRQDIHLAGVLRSPIACFTAAELAEVRLASPKGDLYTSLLKFCETGSSQLTQKTNEFLTLLKAWRDYSRRKGVPDLVWQIYRDTGYYDYVGGMPGGTLRQANLRALYDRARQYEATNFRGLFRFLRFIAQMQDKGSDLAVARALGESEDVVRVMSIHKSKGLEFPVVFVCDLDKKFNLQDTRGLVLCHKTLGVGPYVTVPEQRYRYPTIARRAIAYKMEMETKAEELRILYVALTRAREKLILVGSGKKIAERANRWCRTVGRRTAVLPESLVAGAKSYLDWLGPAITRHSTGKVLRELGGCDEEPSVVFADDCSHWQVEFIDCAELVTEEQESGIDAPLLEAVKQLRPVDTERDIAWVEHLLSWQYKDSSTVGKPAKMSVTEIKRRFEQQDSDATRPFERRPAFARPRFAQADGKITAAEYGTLIHSVMQHINLNGDVLQEGLKQQINEMVKQEIILAEHADLVDLGAIATFFGSPLGKRLIDSAFVRRELPFSMALPADRFYPELAGKEESIFIQGVVDVLFDDPAGLILLDYKTDRADEASELARKYAVQLNLYAEAIRSIMRKPVAEKYLYVFSTGEVVRVE